ncbi:class E sortase [Cellulomonas fengjieae]|uniref:Class E sortase n=1 Tax=Cellulomonas fengjieae TaxID=2819978 RepID=A0ABS3SHX6_9CELL|nr:class E sortase [Cellulomonas fengjieae]MBO3085359.1 class E sortase [Cellulomonas fengjieae]QVI66087.1 class E sortase [Cellulomonas fengjieae]
MTGATATETRRHQPGRHDTVYGVVGVVGELLITFGVLIFAFLVWQLWWTDVEGNRVQAEIVRELPFEPVPTADSVNAGPVIATPRRDEPPVMAEPAYGTTFATIQVPRWDGEPARPVSEGTERATVLDVLGIGHYEGTVMPGGLGNVALAGHRTTYAKPFNRVAELQPGDPLVIRTTDNVWYVYRVTSTQIVDPGQVDVIAPVPGEPGAVPTERLITLTTCHPMFSARERFIVHGVLDYWAPTADGIPVELTGGA